MKKTNNPTHGYSIILLLLLSTFSFLGNAQTTRFTVTGTITDESGVPFPGASIIEKGTTNGVQSDFDASFSITVSSSNSTLVISYIGFKTIEMPINGQSKLNITLKEDTTGLEAIVVVGYGTQRRKDLTGAITSINAEEISKRGVTNVSEALRGRIAGLSTTVSNSPSGGTNFLVRGDTSLSGGTAPLIVLDGVIYYGSLSDINANDVQSIDVLKDASSAAIFGARSSNGVIIVTTKKGRGKSVINFSSSVGISKLTNYPKFRGPQEFLDFKVAAYETNNPGTSGPNPQFYRNPAGLDGVDINTWRNYGAANPIDPNTTNNEIWFNRLGMSSVELENYEAGRTTDWFDEVTRTGIRRENSISISGGDEKSSHYFSLANVKNEGYILNDQFESIRARVNLETKIKSFFKIGVNGQFSRDNGRGSDNTVTANGELSPSFSRAVVQSPYGAKFNEDGSIRLEPFNDASGINPFFTSSNSTRDIEDDNLIANVFAELELPYGIKYRINWVNSFGWIQDSFFNRTTPEVQGSGGSRRTDRRYTWNVDNILSWEKQFGENHKLDATFVLNAEKRQSSGHTSRNSQFVPSEILGYSNLQIGTNPLVSSYDQGYSADGLLGRLNYGYKGRYLLTGSIRRDGYSVLGANNRRATFLAGAFAWNISDEAFLNDTAWIDNLKLRVSYGQNGNRSDLGLYSSLALLSPTNYIYSDNGADIPVTGLSSTRLGDANLKWESTESLNIGTDFSIFNGTLSGSLEYYKATTTDLIVSRKLPRITGYNSISTNLGRLDNTGFEASLNAIIIDKPDFAWSSSLNYSTNRNEIVELYGDIEDILDDDGNVIGQRLADDRANNWFIGESKDINYGFEINGVYTTDEVDEAAVYGREPGDFRVVDQNGDGVIESIVDQKVLSQRKPKHRINWTNDFTLFKNFNISISLDSQLGHEDAYSGRFGGGLGPNISWQAQRLNGYSFPYWTPENQLNDWARLGSRANGEQYYESKSFVRIQNITLGYTFPNTVTDLLHIDALKLSVDLNNVAIFTNWEFYDPETYRSGGYNQPSARPVPFIGTVRLLITL